MYLAANGIFLIHTFLQKKTLPIDLTNYLYNYLTIYLSIYSPIYLSLSDLAKSILQLDL